MMVINSTDINKTKESINSDGHQIHQYQQNEQSPLILTEHKKDKDILYVYGLGTCTNKGAWLNRIMSPQHTPLDNWISNGNTYLKKKTIKKTCTDRHV